ncbi:MAG TPA: tRNA pseudouridine(38-40) synthase TruA [Bacteroidota bacterium]
MPHRTIKLTLEYDGTEFVGWQFQENGRSVQETVEKGLSQILQEQIRVVGAGRTDSGVHAKGQVASFKTETSLNCALLVRGLNGVFPDDVAALSAEEVAENFNARFDARSRRYRYVIRTIPTALSRNYCWSLGYHLEPELMNQCLQGILGRHNFASFCRTDSEVAHHDCTVFAARWEQPDESSLVFDITADRFLHGMVRSLVGTMVDVGRGYRSVGEFGEILDARDRRKAGMSAPAKGLYLLEVTY